MYDKKILFIVTDLNIDNEYDNEYILTLMHNLRQSFSFKENNFYLPKLCCC